MHPLEKSMMFASCCTTLISTTMAFAFVLFRRHFQNGAIYKRLNVIFSCTLLSWIHLFWFIQNDSWQCQQRIWTWSVFFHYVFCSLLQFQRAPRSIWMISWLVLGTITVTWSIAAPLQLSDSGQCIVLGTLAWSYAIATLVHMVVMYVLWMYFARQFTVALVIGFTFMCVLYLELSEDEIQENLYFMRSASIVLIVLLILYETLHVELYHLIYPTKVSIIPPATAAATTPTTANISAVEIAVIKTPLSIIVSPSPVNERTVAEGADEIKTFTYPNRISPVMKRIVVLRNSPSTTPTPKHVWE